MLFCTKCSRIVFSACTGQPWACFSVNSAIELWCWSANACSSVLSAVELCSRGADQPQACSSVLSVHSSCFFRVVRVSSRVLFCTEFSRSVSSAVDLWSLRGTGQLMLAPLSFYRTYPRVRFWLTTGVIIFLAVYIACCWSAHAYLGIELQSSRHLRMGMLNTRVLFSDTVELFSSRSSDHLT